MSGHTEMPMHNVTPVSGSGPHSSPTTPPSPASLESPDEVDASLPPPPDELSPAVGMMLNPRHEHKKSKLAHALRIVHRCPRRFDRANFSSRGAQRHGRGEIVAFFSEPARDDVFPIARA